MPIFLARGRLVIINGLPSFDYLHADFKFCSQDPKEDILEWVRQNCGVLQKFERVDRFMIFEE